MGAGLLRCYRRPCAALPGKYDGHYFVTVIILRLPGAGICSAKQGQLKVSASLKARTPVAFKTEIREALRRFVDGSIIPGHRATRSERKDAIAPVRFLRK